ncbi:unnamed protein product [Rotaria sp. Silwood1]|nr:unnamed protein product [Rotaria sp. Silwood1]CAF0971842.1 unnamed protein product [Rotaria sp. Silwood1]CAF3393417.1 unnamed protein product [Rotaria sp. Silwood1]CAF3410077.1 unnamed protein product [Rotaria sp. Silwood1]CAF4610516.1 unnamed protein product [Rotaria sp. Silwood1]
MDSNTLILIVVTMIQIPSFFCAIQSVRFSQKNNPLSHIQNHALACLLLVSIWTIGIDLPFTQAYLWLDNVPIRTTWACIFYNVSFFSMTGLNRVLMAFMCIERHFLVFHNHLYRTHRSRLLFHYIPFYFTILSIVIYFIIINTLISCGDISFDYTRFMCGYTCAIRIRNLGMVYIWLNVFVPTAITTIASILLPIRFVIQKTSLHRLQWYRARKMIIQTSIIAGAYVICWLPYSIVLQLLVNGILSFSDPNITLFFIYGPYITSLLTPFIVQHTIPGWMNKKLVKQIKLLFFPQQRLTQPRTGIFIPQ